MKLKIGDIILIHGWPMLEKLVDGQKYRVKNTPDHYGNPTYQFTLPKGKKVICRHYCDSVDISIGGNDLNRIEIVS